MQFHILSFEGPDDYARAGGIASRVSGLARALADAGFDTHLWFIGAPDLPGHESHDHLHLHRWCQWISRYHPTGVYEGEEGKRMDYAASLPPFLCREVLLPYLQRGGHGIILAEEWHTVDAILHLHWLLEQAQVRPRVTMFWNANNTFSFERIDWGRLAAAATITTVSRYMKHLMQRFGVNPLVVPNGLATDAMIPPERGALAAFRSRLRHRTVLSKVARWDPDKRWLSTIATVGAMRQQGWQPLLIARGGLEAHGYEVLAAAAACGLKVVERVLSEPGFRGIIQAMEGLERADVVNIRSPLDGEARRLLFQGSAAVLANSGHEPFGLVGLETMAVGGLACTGCTGEDYAVPGYNALVLETDDPEEFIHLYGELRAHPSQDRALRRAGCLTAKHFEWPGIIRRILLPRLQLIAKRSHPAAASLFRQEENGRNADSRRAHVTLASRQRQRRRCNEARVKLMVGGKALQATHTADTPYEAASIALKTIQQERRGLRALHR